MPVSKGFLAVFVTVVTLALVATVFIFWDWTPDSPADPAVSAPDGGTAQDADSSASSEPVSWSNSVVAFTYPEALCQVTQTGTAPFRLSLTAADGASLPRIDLQSLTADSALETPTETEFIQFSQAVLERYFVGGLTDDAFSAGTPELAADRWTVPVTVRTPDGAELSAQVSLLNPGSAPLLSVCLLDAAEAQAADWQAVYDSIAPAA